MMESKKIRLFPKVELHCHLDGSVSPDTLQKIAGKEHPAAAETFVKTQRQIIKADGTGNLETYLKCFDEVLPYLQTEDALRTAAYGLISQAAADQVLYMEVRFAPMFHCRGGLDQTRVTEAVLRGLELAERDLGVKSRVLLCMMRGQDDVLNWKTLACAREMREYGVAGIDLAGNEAAYPPELYEKFFASAREWEIPFTIHAGECQSVQNVRTSIEMGAKRIGHGIAVAQEEEVQALCRKQEIVLEMCPVSNLQTGAAKEITEYPFEEFLQKKIPVTVNTDNRAVSETTLEKEWTLLGSHYKTIGEQSMLEAGLYAIQGAFLPWQEKAKLMQDFQKKVRQLSSDLI